MVESTVAFFSARAEAQGIDLGAVIKDKPVITADTQQLAILPNNLVDNALAHTPSEGRIDVGVDILDGCPTISVPDTGRGAPESERPLVFDRFYRGIAVVPADRIGKSSRADFVHVDASGLELAIVRAVAERRGAEVSLEESDPRGLRVSVRFTERRP